MYQTSQRIILIYYWKFFYIRRNTGAQKLPLHLPAVSGKRLPKCNGMPAVGIRNLIHDIHKALLFNVFHDVNCDSEPKIENGKLRFYEKWK